MNSKRAKMERKNNQKSRRSSQSIPTLLTEIIIEILLKLPVESLLRCKSVCKEWYSLISDKHFIKSHYSLSSTNINFAHLVFISERSYDTRRLKRCPLNDVMFDNSVNNAMDCFAHPYKSSTISYPRIDIVGSCNGLLCIIFEGYIHIYNPSTRILNRIYCGFKYSWRTDLCFGFDELNDDYKIVARSYLNQKVRMYSLKSGEWKNLCKVPNKYYYNLPGVYSNGALHWAEPGRFSHNKWKIHSLDLTKEIYDEVLQPEYDEANMELELGAVGKWLCVLCNYSESHADLWVLKVYGVKDSWTKLASIPFDPIMDQFPDYMCDWKLKFSDPLCISNDGKVLLRFGGKSFVFDSKNITFTLVKEIGYNAQPCILVESLVSPKHANGICSNLRSSSKRLWSSHVSS